MADKAAACLPRKQPRLAFGHSASSEDLDDADVVAATSRRPRLAQAKERIASTRQPIDKQRGRSR